MISSRLVTHNTNNIETTVCFHERFVIVGEHDEREEGWRKDDDDRAPVETEEQAGLCAAGERLLDSRLSVSDRE